VFTGTFDFLGAVLLVRPEAILCFPTSVDSVDSVDEDASLAILLDLLFEAVGFDSVFTLDLTTSSLAAFSETSL